MTTYRIIEEDQGTYTARTPHPHNGYYAGDFGHSAERPVGSAMTHQTRAGDHLGHGGRHCG